eukprot:1140012-Pelagomonas_calceolata.AAC.9
MRRSGRGALRGALAEELTREAGKGAMQHPALSMQCFFGCEGRSKSTTPKRYLCPTSPAQVAKMRQAAVMYRHP